MPLHGPSVSVIPHRDKLVQISETNMGRREWGGQGAGKTVLRRGRGRKATVRNGLCYQNISPAHHSHHSGLIAGRSQALPQAGDRIPQ